MGGFEITLVKKETINSDYYIQTIVSVSETLSSDSYIKRTVRTLPDPITIPGSQADEHTCEGNFQGACINGYDDDWYTRISPAEHSVAALTFEFNMSKHGFNDELSQITVFHKWADQDPPGTIRRQTWEDDVTQYVFEDSGTKKLILRARTQRAMNYVSGGLRLEAWDGSEWVTVRSLTAWGWHPDMGFYELELLHSNPLIHLKSDAEIIEKTSILETIDSDAHIKIIDITETLDSDYVISREEDSEITSDYYIQTSVSETLSSDANIELINIESLFSDYVIQIIEDRELESDYFIKTITEEQLSSDAFITGSEIETIDSDYVIRNVLQETLESDAEILAPIIYQEGILSDYTIYREFAGGDGSPGDPYQISEWTHLNNIRLYPSAHFIILNSLSSSLPDYNKYAGHLANGEQGWIPIPNFSGNLNGNEKEIVGLFIDRPTEDNVGFIGTSNSGDVYDLKIRDVDFTGGDNVGAMIGYSSGTTFDRNYSSGIVNGNSNVGGFVGSADNSVIRECFSLGSVSGIDVIGGFVGLNSETDILDCYTFCSVTRRQAPSVLIGGFVGVNTNSSSITNCYSIGMVFEFSGIMWPGLNKGFAGSVSSGATDTNCYFDSQTSGQTSSAGTAQARSTADMTFPYNSGNTYIGWDFSDVWDINDEDNLTYPFLQWQIFPTVESLIAFNYTKREHRQIRSETVRTTNKFRQYILFTPTRTGLIRRIHLRLRGSGTASAQITLQGVSSNVVELVDSQSLLYTFEFPSPVFFRQGVQDSIELSATQGSFQVAAGSNDESGWNFQLLSESEKESFLPVPDVYQFNLFSDYVIEEDD